jgi:hypothetical protein
MAVSFSNLNPPESRLPAHVALTNMHFPATGTISGATTMLTTANVHGSLKIDGAGPQSGTTQSVTPSGGNFNYQLNMLVPDPSWVGKAATLTISVDDGGTTTNFPYEIILGT